MKQSYLLAGTLALALGAVAFANRDRMPVLAPAQIPDDAVLTRVETASESTEHPIAAASLANIVTVDMAGNEIAARPGMFKAEGDSVPEGFKMALNLEKGEAWVYKCTSTAAEVTIPDFIKAAGVKYPVTFIYNNAFTGVSNMETCNFGANIKGIDTKAFMACMKLATVNLNEGLLEIGPEAFSTFCSKITSLTLPSSVVTLGERCFSGTTLTGEFIINKNLKTIGGGAFAGKKITGFYIGEEGNDNFTSADGVLFTKDGQSLVVYPPALIEPELTLPASVTKLAPYSFAYCTTLKKINLSENMASIGSFAFKGCNLTEFTIGKNVTELGAGVFQENKNLNTITLDPANTSFTQTDGMIVSKASKTLLAVPFNITDVNVPEGVETISENLCYNNPNVKSLTAPASVRTIGNSAFFKCTALTGPLTFPGVERIGNSAFHSTGDLDTVYCPATLKFVGDRSFASSQIKGIVLQEGVDSICTGAFMSTPIEKANIPGSASYIGGSTFYQCTALSELTLGEGMPYIPEVMCYGCEKLYFMDFPSTIKEVGNSAFSYSWLQIADLPEGVTRVGNSAFQLAPLHYIDLPNSLVEIDDLGFSITNAEYIKCGTGLRSIGSNGFQSNKQATSIQLNEGLLSLGKRALYGEKVPEITLPSTVEEIGDSLLLNSNITKLINLSPEPQALNSEICGIYNPYPTVTPIYSTCTLAVPYGSKVKYEAEPYWQLFTNIEELPEDSGVGSACGTIEVVRVYDRNGILLDSPEPGINICVMSDGSVRKRFIH